MASSPEVSVVLATHERPERLARALASLRAQDLPSARYEVVVVDDASGPATRRLLAEESERTEKAQLQVLRHDVARGPGGARDAGWRAARGELVAFTDDDCEASPSWLSKLVQAAREHPGAIVQGRTVPNPADGDGTATFAHTLSVDRLGPWYETANMLYPRRVLEAIDGFDPSFSRTGEDADLAWRAMAAGSEPVWQPEAIVYHAVEAMDWLGLLRRAWRWDETMLCFKRHPGLRRELHARLFWTRAHLELALALVAAVPRVPLVVRALLVAPYLRRLYAGRRTPTVAPFRILLDLTEMAACARGALRYGVPVL